MSEKTIFFSYSRENSDFVINLAKELRNAGAGVWLDQLDIKPGTRWDKSIEDALQSSKTLLVILSGASVASHNVMDEVSYALEEGKTVVPVLLEPCEIPFRLRRLQFADFTESHEKGKITLIKALGLEGQVANKLAGGALKEDQTSSKSTTPTSGASKESAPIKKETKEPVKTAAEQSVPAPGKSSGSKKALIYIVIAVVAVFAAWGIYSVVSGGGEDMMALCKADWEELDSAVTGGEEINELAALRRHIELYAPCPHENEAMDRISFLKAMGGESGTLTTENAGEPLEKNAVETTNSGNANANKSNDKQEKPVEVEEEVVEEVVEPVELTGNNVVRVDYSGGYFEQESANSWLEVNNNGERIFSLVKRDLDAVYLMDGDVRIEINISNSEIYYADTNTEPFLLYTITKILGNE